MVGPTVAFVGGVMYVVKQKEVKLCGLSDGIKITYVRWFIWRTSDISLCPTAVDKPSDISSYVRQLSVAIGHNTIVGEFCFCCCDTHTKERRVQ